ncbi:hypothetical protein JTE90_006173 [Oedothorax gibbosus]|uniref:MBD domain-containing protein n=1 Tax=Oedothorax gibbosus TaxID=931172 RepID=A0AAV6TR21_9ARAC|nr:hypothetical protein JTE90_006173 [Oedothorax gibbosus]
MSDKRCCDNTNGETSEDEFELLEPKCKDYTSESDTKNWERVKTRRGDVYYLPKIRDKSIRLRNINEVSRYCSDNNIEFNPEDFDFEDKSVNYTALRETTSTDSDPEVNLVEVKIPNSFEESLTSPESHDDNTNGETSEDEFELLEPKCKDYTSESDKKNWERMKTRRGDVYYLPKIRDKSIRLRYINEVSRYCSDNNIEFNPEDFDFEDKSVNYTALRETTSTDSDPEVNLVEVKIPNSFEESLTSPESHEWVKAMKI